MRFILASGSPRRKELLTQVGISFSVEVPNIDESVLPEEQVEELVCRLAAEKAVAVGGYPDSLVLAADTVVSCDGHVLGKPGSNEQAISMLSFLSGRSHEVLTGMALLDSAGTLQSITCSSTKVFFRKLDQSEIIKYVTREDVRNCAGAYRIQDKGVFLIEKIVGSYSNVVGLPLETLYSECSKLGIDLL